MCLFWIRMLPRQTWPSLSGPLPNLATMLLFPRHSAGCKKEGVDINDLTYTTFAITNENKYTVKVKDLNAALLSAGAIKRRPYRHCNAR